MAVSIEFIGYPNCGTCRKAWKLLEEKGSPMVYRHIVEQPPTLDELREWVPKSGIPARKWFNTSGSRYKQLGLKDKLPSMSEEEMLELLASDGMLVKRPVIRKEDEVQVGFKA